MVVKTLKFEVRGSRGRPKQTQKKKQVENELKKNGMVKEDVCDRSKWRGVEKDNDHTKPGNSVDGDKTGSKAR